jgi:hypothetical protein
MRITEELLEWKSSGSGSRKSRLMAWEPVTQKEEDVNKL